MRRALAALAALSLVAAPASAASPPSWAGVWRGTIGALPISVCLGAPGEYSTDAAYYYHRTMRTISLEQDKDGAWLEHGEGGEKVTGTWQFNTAASDRLTGTWTLGAKTLPIALTRVPFKADDAASPCGTREFLAPRIAPAKLKRSAKQLGAFAYTALAWDVGPGFADVDIASFEYPPTRPGDRAINAALRLDPDKPGSRADYLDCLQSQHSSIQVDGEYYLTFEPIHASANYLGVVVNEAGSCGGAHPYHGYSYQTWDRNTGRAVELRSWFAPKAFKRVTYPGDPAVSYQATPAFARFLARQLKYEDSTCREAVEAAEFWDVGLTAGGGLIFTPSLAYVETACIDDVRLPLVQLKPWLGPEGQRAAARL